MELKNFGKLANDNEGIAGYSDEGGLILCAECAADTTTDGKPFINDDCDVFYTMYSNGESDSPTHCDFCGALIHCSLTTDGAEYVKKYCEENDNAMTALYRKEFDWVWL